MLVGVLCEVVSVVSSVEKEQLLVSYVKQQLQTLILETGADNNGDGLLSKDEFQTIIQNPKAVRALTDIGVDIIGLIDLVDFIFKGKTDLSFADFMDVVLKLRGSNTATVKDIIDLRKFLMAEIAYIAELAEQPYIRSQLPDMQMMHPNRPSGESLPMTDETHVQDF